MSTETSAYQDALQQARDALRLGDFKSARDCSRRAIALSPDTEDGWLILAAASNPRASMAYLERALEINPESQRAKRGMQWALKRWRGVDIETIIPQAAPASIPITDVPKAKTTRPTRVPGIIWLTGVLSVILFGIAAWLIFPIVSSCSYDEIPLAMAQIIGFTTDTPTPTPTFTNTPAPTDTATFTPTYTSSPTATFTLTPTSTSTSTPTTTPTSTATPLPSDTPMPTPTPTEIPTNPPPPTPGPDGNFEQPQVEAGEHWVDVDLSQQMAYAYEGNQIVRSFVISTGRKYTPTVTGLYRIYVKYRSADMSGPGYYLPDVPYVMYFYKGYGLHGTYWHNNFGHPMSHGCVNFRTEDARWLFNFLSLRSLVNVHK